MPRRLKTPGRLSAAPATAQAPATPQAPKAAPASGTSGRRRRLKKSGDDPLKLNLAVVQFVRYPAGAARALDRLRHSQALEPTAFSWWPWGLGGSLTAIESERVMRGVSIRVAGLQLEGHSGVLCFECCVEIDRDHAYEVGYGRAVPIYEGDDALFTCVECGEEFEGEDA